MDAHGRQSRWLLVGAEEAPTTDLRQRDYECLTSSDKCDLECSKGRVLGRFPLRTACCTPLSASWHPGELLLMREGICIQSMHTCTVRAGKGAALQ